MLVLAFKPLRCNAKQPICSTVHRAEKWPVVELTQSAEAGTPVVGRDRQSRPKAGSCPCRPLTTDDGGNPDTTRLPPPEDITMAALIPPPIGAC
jgi:hypothetical protein